MSFLQALLAVVLTPLAVTETTNTAMAAKLSKDPSCEIRLTNLPGGIRLEAVVLGRAGASGEYEFTVAKSGSGGTSDVSQGGEFDLGASTEAVVGEVTLGSGEKPRVKARLTVSSTGGKMLCEDNFPH